MLRENAFLKFLNIDGIAIGDDGAANIADALTTNEKLEELHMVKLDTKNTAFALDT